MRHVLFDTSVIIAGSFQSHPHHAQSQLWLDAVIRKKLKASLSTHALAEIFAGLSVIPHGPIITPGAAKKIIDQGVLSYFEMIELSLRDYRMALDRVVLYGVSSGGIYDALHVQSAVKKKIASILTFNEKDFARMIKFSELEVLDPLIDTP